MKLHTHALYTYDKSGQITGSNQFDGGSVPCFHLAKTFEGNFSIFRHDFPSGLKKSILNFVQKEPLLSNPLEPPKFREQYLTLLSQHQSIESIWHGPAYYIRKINYSDSTNIIHINEGNKNLLKPLMNDWIPDVPHRTPFVAAVINSHAVAVCASVRITPEAHEAGVETHPNYRGRGLALKTVSAWAKAVNALNAVPLYSTSWDNHASQAIAQKLEMDFIGTDFHAR